MNTHRIDIPKGFGKAGNATSSNGGAGGVSFTRNVPRYKMTVTANDKGIFVQANFLDPYRNIIIPYNFVKSRTLEEALQAARYYIDNHYDRENVWRV